MSAAISSRLRPSDSSYVVGAVSLPHPAPSSSSFASIQSVEALSLPPQVTAGIPAGTRSRASTVSALTQETVTIRVGSASMTVSP